MTAPELAALKALVAAEEGREAAAQLSDNRREEDRNRTTGGYPCAESMDRFSIGVSTGSE
jgi:hypothetical protein